MLPLHSFFWSFVSFCLGGSTPKLRMIRRSEMNQRVIAWLSLDIQFKKKRTWIGKIRNSSSDKAWHPGKISCRSNTFYEFLCTGRTDQLVGVKPRCCFCCGCQRIISLFKGESSLNKSRFLLFGSYVFCFHATKPHYIYIYMFVVSTSHFDKCFYIAYWRKSPPRYSSLI